MTYRDKLRAYLASRERLLCLEANAIECRYDVMPEHGRVRLVEIHAERVTVGELTAWVMLGCPDMPAHSGPDPVLDAPGARMDAAE